MPTGVSCGVHAPRQLVRGLSGAELGSHCAVARAPVSRVADASSSSSSCSALAGGGVVGAALGALAPRWWRQQRRRGEVWRGGRRPAAAATRRRAVPLAELLERGSAEELEHLLRPSENLQAFVANLSDLSRCTELLAEVFEANTAETECMKRGLASRLGAKSSIFQDVLRPTLRRPVPLGSTVIPELGLIFGYATAGDLDQSQVVALIDVSLWPHDGRVRQDGARSKQGVASKPYVLNLCVSPVFRRRGLAAKLVALAERLIRDVWGDTEIYLHVYDDALPANALYEACGYEALQYTYDKEFPYSKAEAELLRTSTWRLKTLQPRGADEAAIQPAAVEEVQDDGEVQAEDEEEEDKEEEAEEAQKVAEKEAGKEEEAEEAQQKAENKTWKMEEADDFDWVTQIKKK